MPLNKEKFKSAYRVLFNGFLNSYAQIFFSSRKLLALIIMAVTFMDINAGVCGIIGVAAANIIAYLMGFNRFNIASGFYGFNSLLVSLGIGVYYSYNAELLVIIIFAAVLTLMLTLLLQGVLSKYGVPYLSLPFLLALWLVTLATRNFTTLVISQSDVYALNEMYVWGGTGMLGIYNWFNGLELNQEIIVYLRSLGAIFFQYNVFAGILLALGLLIYSRQAFLLSILGFVAACYYYRFIGANINELYYTNIGFNFILTAIALGGFFVIPSFYSYLFVILLTPVISILLASTAALFAPYQLSVFSLPFNIVVIVFLYILKFREYRFHIPEVVAIPKSSPEENMYMQKNATTRFSNLIYLPVDLPVRGLWHIAQGHDGELTHKEQWKYAWDFDIIDEKGKTYKGEGLLLDDYYCYNKPVMAPADGVVESIVYEVGDNEIGDVNLENNWGNTIIIRHQPYLYSKLSHLKAGTFKVQEGETVKKGQVLAHVGNSGRSPEPHLHFQLQATPFIESGTIAYPVAHFIVHNTQESNSQVSIKSFTYPAKDQIVSNLNKEPLIYDAFHFIPGQKIRFSVDYNGNRKETVEWEVVTDIYNATYLYCPKTKSKAFIYNDGKIHYFTNYEGSRSSLLYHFYLGSYKILLSFYKNLELKDAYPLNKMTRNNVLLWIQDFVAPFWIFIKCPFVCVHAASETSIDLESVTYRTNAQVKILGNIIRSTDYEIFIEDNKIQTFTVKGKNKIIKAECNA